VRDQRLAPTAGVVRVMFDAIDLVQTLTAEIASNGQERVTIDIVLENLRRAAAAAVAPGEPLPVAPPTAAAKTELPAGQSAASPATGANGGGGDANETVRVRMERLDAMVNLTGELVVARSRFQLVARQLRPLQRVTELDGDCEDLLDGLSEIEARAARGGDGVATAIQQLAGRLLQRGRGLLAGCQELAGMGRVLRDLDEVAYDFDGVVGGIHEAVLQLRMVPLDGVFRRLQRVVRDTAELLGKGVDFEVSGGEAQIDKHVADELVNPLVHMLRNSVDHGLESAAVRRAAGKPERGRISVTTYKRGSSVVLEVRDDGGGIDPARVLKKAIACGLVTADEAAAMSPRDAQRLIFAPGFTTAAAVSEVSGRGMGMDIIAASIKKLRGSLELASEVGVGTCFTVQLPPSMSILSSLLLEVRGTMFAMPLTEVREIVELSRLRVQSVQQRRTIVVRDRPMPLVLLPETFRFPGAAPAGDDAPRHAIVFGFPGNEVALGVDRLVGKEDLVIKPLCAELTAVRGLAGMAIRGDGKVTLILDPSGLADFAVARHHACAEGRSA
jgi:two-component system chemotaxis sensor kinase CheA